MPDPTPTPPKLISNPDETYQANIITCAVITWTADATFVGLRFYTRGILLQNILGAEDWLILVALLFSGATCAGMVEQAIYGLGKHALDINPELMTLMARVGWYTILWYLLSLLFTKISILLLYIRILSYQHARYAVYAILVIVIFTNGLWTLSTVVTACVPLQAFWDPALRAGAYCHTSSYWFANTGMHICTDILLYILPLPIITSLQVKLRQKLVLYAIFALGFFVCSISAVRLWDLLEEYKRIDFTFDSVSISYLTCIEINAAIACACCMTLKPFVTRYAPRLIWGGGSRLSSDMSPASSPSDPERGKYPPTIGSKPSRTYPQTRHYRQHLWMSATHTPRRRDDDVGLLTVDDKNDNTEGRSRVVKGEKEGSIVVKETGLFTADGKEPQIGEPLPTQPAPSLPAMVHIRKNKGPM